MRIFLAFFALMVSTLGFSQSAPSWKVLHNGRLLLQAVEEAPDKNVIVVNRSTLAKTGALQVTFGSAAEKGWERTIMLLTENDVELRTAKGNALTVSNAGLRTLAKGKKQLMLYTLSLPKDPKQRALVRVRRMHLCTIEIKG